MNIALCHFRVKDIDGVSLEMEKCKTVLEQMGHSVCFIAGNEAGKETYPIEELHYNHPLNNKIVKNAYTKLEDWPRKTTIENIIFDYAKHIENKLTKIITERKIDIIVPHNIFSLGWNLSAAIAFYNACIKTNTHAVCHHHDFWWERTKYATPTLPFISKILKKYFPPNHPLFTHIVINKIAQKALSDYRDMESKVVPNVFDFKSDSWKKDDYNQDFRKRIGVKDNDLIFLQSTRVVERKAIELAIDVVAEVNRRKDNLVNRKLYNNQVFMTDSSIYLILSNLNESVDYYNKLMQYALNKNVELRDINQHIRYCRTIENNEKKYALWDAYVFADIVTYPSIKEGWGNQFLEILFAKKPAIVFEYPVFKTDIKQFQFNVVSLGDHYTQRENGLKKVNQKKINEAVDQSIKYLTDNVFRNKKMKKNFEIGRKYLSLQNLENILKPLF